mmetsp:Transcript_19710/g.34035  ORF Transcript_19710/g.34035 Transcript_19710/m.34035 type:complete len:228 (+) Transcript_19710:37-720(+)
MADLEDLLAGVIPTPACLPSQASVLALALHLLTVQDGFVVEEPLHQGSATAIRPTYAPAIVENPGVATTEWTYTYSRPGRENLMQLVVSIHAPSGRCFVHMSEHRKQSNAQILGLQLDKYVSPGCITADSWAGAMTSTDVLIQQFREHILLPLLANASRSLTPVVPKAAAASQSPSPSPAAGTAPPPPPRPWLTADQAVYLGAASVVVASTAVVVLMLFSNRSRGGR